MTPTDEITRLREENRRLKEERDTWRAQYHRDMADVIRERDAAVKRAEQAERERDALRDCKRPGTLAEPGCGQCVACWRGAYEDANDRAEERRDKAKETDRLRAEVEALRQGLSLYREFYAAQDQLSGKRQRDDLIDDLHAWEAKHGRLVGGG
jgi:hypothetical protein